MRRPWGAHSLVNHVLTVGERSSRGEYLGLPGRFQPLNDRHIRPQAGDRWRWAGLPDLTATIPEYELEFPLAQSDPELDGVRYAFDAAFQRMCEATTHDALMAELSNLFHHLFRVRELCKHRLGSSKLYATEKSTSDLRAARAASWARNFDTHQLYAVASQQDVYSNFYTAMYGILVWKPLSSLPQSTDKYGRHLDYATELEGKPVLDTLRCAFDALAGLL